MKTNWNRGQNAQAIWMMLIAMALGLAGCGIKGGDPVRTGAVAPGTPLPTTPGCKPINSLWQSQVDIERHDLTNVVYGQATAGYVYQGPSGAICGFPGNPNNTLTALLEVPADYQITAGWDYRLVLNYTLSLGAQCNNYGPVNDPNQYAYVVHNCTEIQICNAPNIYAQRNQLINCRSFR